MLEQGKTISPLSIVMLVSVIISLVPAFLQAFPFWKDLDGSYFHQPLLLAGTIWLVLKSRKKYVSCECPDTSRGLLLKTLILLFCSYFYCTTVVYGFTTLLSLAVPAYIGAILYFLFGKTLLRKVLFFLILLALSFPFPNLLVAASEWFLQKGTIIFSILVLKILDGETICSGTTLLSLGESVRIGQSCSGINSFLILIPLVLVASRLFAVQRGRTVWIGLCLPFSVMAFNSLRVASMFFASLFIDFNLAVRHFHNIGPLFFFMNAWFILFLMRGRGK